MRADRWLCDCTAGELIEIVEDPKRFGKLPTLDQLITRFIYNAVTAKAGDNRPLNDLFDRFFGKPRQEVETWMDVTTTQVESVSAVHDWLKQICEEISQ